MVGDLLPLTSYLVILNFVASLLNFFLCELLGELLFLIYEDIGALLYKFVTFHFFGLGGFLVLLSFVFSIILIIFSSFI